MNIHNYSSCEHSPLFPAVREWFSWHVFCGISEHFRHTGTMRIRYDEGLFRHLFVCASYLMDVLVRSFVWDVVGSANRTSTDTIIKKNCPLFGNDSPLCGIKRKYAANKACTLYCNILLLIMNDFSDCCRVTKL